MTTQLQTVLDALILLGRAANISHNSGSVEAEAIAIVRGMMSAEPVAGMNQNGVIREAGYRWGINDEVTPLYAAPHSAHPAPQAVPAWFPTQESIKALKRFEETCMDSEGYDVSKEVMRQLAMIGLVYHASAGSYGITDFGNSVLAAAPAVEDRA